MGRLLTPSNTLIVATREVVWGQCSIIDDEVTRGEDGKFVFDFGGYGTDIDWDSQETVKQDGQLVFVDEDGVMWREDQLTLVEDDRPFVPDGDE